MSAHVYDQVSYSRTSLARAISALKVIADLFAAMKARSIARNQYRELMDAPDKILEDIGVTRDQIRRKIERPLWKL